MIKIFLLSLFFYVSCSWAVIETYAFKTPEQQAQYNRLIDELRCPKCQNQNLSGSNAPIAQDLRFQVYRLINQDKPENEIIDFLVARYGDFVRYNPPINTHTFVLWGIPAVLFFIGLLVVFRIKRGVQEKASSLTTEEATRLDEILKVTR
jgi:cytochrome c-type biogenesis protein CcmH